MSDDEEVGAAETVISGTKAQLVGQAVHTAANAGLIVLLTNVLLSPADYGRLFLAISVVGALRAVSGTGLSSSAARYITDFRTEDPGQIPYILRFSLLVRIGIVGLVGVGLVLTSGFISSQLGEPALGPVLVVGAGYMIVHTTNQTAQTLFQGFNRVGWSALVMGTNSSVRVVRGEHP